MGQNGALERDDGPAAVNGLGDLAGQGNLGHDRPSSPTRRAEHPAGLGECAGAAAGSGAGRGAARPAVHLPRVGATEYGFPRGYRRFQRSRPLADTTDFEAAAADLLRWQVHRRAGLRVCAESTVAEPGAVVVLSLLGLSAPCRVVHVVAEPDRRGFAYGTLPGHPEAGEEAFMLERDRDGGVAFTIRAFSRPATVLTRVAGPLGRRVQDVMTRRCLRAL
ncbi:DUF1990 family protein [Amycolatopsis sp. GM8]|uniref:DUF1990 family protein n=1 Tax=Amycolatopsis sp. GM8 TaxID=2896530 RepID=UPI001F409B5E|nr:DUF1990 domain-containing protein [Amycolatopsis sp. GM8]